ncbi:carbohydrate sulfotransferase 1-like isoform X1 [Branchiostoma floridae]|uniref:Sulfotransferase n=1 Tax=Branchiostoma floridae TaxID=7739 RepID=A0A9J7KRR6_BRAFL|nr:carbohydrate sulfotransferase 1-like isoform X1 [Branchiostoma floridae]
MIKMYKRCLSLKKALLLVFCVGCTSFMYYLVMLPNDAREAAKSKFETPAEVRSRVERETRATETSLLSPNEPHHAPPTVKVPDNVKHTPKEPDNAQPAPKEPDNAQSAPKQPNNAQPIPKVPDNVQPAPKEPDNAQPAPKYSDCKCGKPTPQEPVKPTSTEAAEHKRTAVIIMTRMRSGSTFVGEIFNQHPEAFYIFEPIWALENHRNKTYNSPKFQVEWLHSLADCRLDGVQDILNVYLTSKGLGVMATCRAVDGLCARYRNFTSQWPGRCPIPDDKMSQVVGNACLTKRFTAIKTIRLEDIDPLQQIAENAEINLKVIQLVRDPRGVIASRLSLVQKNVSVMTALHNQVDENEVRELCDWMTRNKPTNQGPNSWLQKHHALLRYEDIGRNPIGLMKKVYKFIDTPSHENVTKWLQTHTKTSKKIKERRDPFGTKKDPEKTMNEWRTKLNFKDVQKIQSICKEAMYMHGYKFVMSESEMSDSSLNFHGPNVSLLDIK